MSVNLAEPMPTKELTCKVSVIACKLGLQTEQKINGKRGMLGQAPNYRYPYVDHQRCVYRYLIEPVGVALLDSCRRKSAIIYKQPLQVFARLAVYAA